MMACLLKESHVLQTLSFSDLDFAAQQPALFMRAWERHLK
jgi:hypothetical protein